MLKLESERLVGEFQKMTLESQQMGHEGQKMIGRIKQIQADFERIKLCCTKMNDPGKYYIPNWLTRDWKFFPMHD